MMYAGLYLVMGIMSPFIAGLVMVIMEINRYGMEFVTWHNEEVSPADIGLINIIYTLIAWPVLVPQSAIKLYAEQCKGYEEYKAQL